MIGAEVEHKEGNQRAGVVAPAPVGSAVEGLPDGLLRAGYRHRAAPDLSQPDRLFSWRLALITLAKDVAPVVESSVGGNERAALMAVASGDDLIEEIGSLLVEGKISQFVHD